MKSTDGNSFCVLLLPQNVTPGTPWIEITVGGRTVTYPVPAGLTTLNEGEEKVVNLKLTNDSGVSYSTYLTGWYRNDNYDTFVYTLVNDAQTELSPPAGGSDAYPKAMAVSGGKTYVSGGYLIRTVGQELVIGSMDQPRNLKFRIAQLSKDPTIPNQSSFRVVKYI